MKEEFLCVFIRLNFRLSLVSGLRPSLRGRNVGSFPEQRLVIEPMCLLDEEIGKALFMSFIAIQYQS